MQLLQHRTIHFLAPKPPFPPPLASSFHKPTTVHRPSSHLLPSGSPPWLSLLRGPPIAAAAASTFDPQDVGGPVELPPDTPSIFSLEDEPGSLQVGTSVVLFGAITFFLFRSLRRRAQRAKELRFRSSGVKKAMKDEASESLKAIGKISVEPGSPPSPVQALLGGLTAGVIALVLYKFTTTVEASLNSQVLSDNYSARQITITVRTIVNGICYLATFIFGINSVGLLLYSGQLAINSFIETATGKGASSVDEKQETTPTSSPEIPSGDEGIGNSLRDQSSDVPEK